MTDRPDPAHVELPPEVAAEIEAKFTADPDVVRRRAEAMGMRRSRLQLCPTKYVLGTAELFQGSPEDHSYDSNAIHVTWHGGDSWAVTRGAGDPRWVWCDADGKFELEPTKSSQTDEFRQRTRYCWAEVLDVAPRAHEYLQRGTQKRLTPTASKQWESARWGSRAVTWPADSCRGH